MKDGDRYIRNKDRRQYEVICIARSQNKQTGMWTNFDVVHRPTDGIYPSYVMPKEDFLNQFQEDKSR